MARGGARLGAGGPRKTRAQHEISGTLRPSRVNPHEPSYAVEAPEKPAHVAANPVASAEWDRVVPMLLEQRVITRAFHAALEAYVGAYSDVVAGETVKAAPDFEPYIQGSRGLQPHPVFRMLDAARKELRSWAGVLGLLPTTVGKVAGAPASQEADPEDALLARIERRQVGGDGTHLH